MDADETRRCPDCDCPMEPVEFTMSDAHNPQRKADEKRDGLLGTLGVDERRGW